MILKGNIYGKNTISEKIVSIDTITSSSTKAAIWGDIFYLDTRITKDKLRKIFIFKITDYTNSITVKILSDINSCKNLENLKKMILFLFQESPNTIHLIKK